MNTCLPCCRKPGQYKAAEGVQSVSPLYSRHHLKHETGSSVISLDGSRDNLHWKHVTYGKVLKTERCDLKRFTAGECFLRERVASGTLQRNVCGPWNESGLHLKAMRLRTELSSFLSRADLLVCAGKVKLASVFQKSNLMLFALLRRQLKVDAMPP